MSKVRDLPQTTTLADDDLLYAVDFSAGPNGGRKITKADLKTSVAPTAAETKAAYESNPDTNAFTDAEKTKLGTVFAGAKFQNADEVPFDNTGTGLTATEVQTAIEQVNIRAQADFMPSIVSGRILHYSGGTARFDDVFYQLVANDILLNSNVTNGEVYVDLDGLVKQTSSGVTAPPLSIVFAKFSTDLNNIISLTDERVKNSQNLVRGLLTDVRDIRAGATAVAGASGRLSDAMHAHNILTGAPSTQNTDQANAEGTSINLARADHTHNIPTAAPSTVLSPATTNAQGVATSFTRSDHTHAVATALVADITTILPDDTASAGTANTFARGDHRHAIVAATAVSLTTASTNAEGASTSFARADHTHAVSVSNQEATATADDTTTSATDVLMVSMTQTPTAGTYFVMWTGSIVNSANGAERTFVSLYLNGTQVSATERSVGTAGGAYAPTAIAAIITTPGSQAIEARWRVAGGTSTVHSRRLTLLRLSN